MFSKNNVFQISEFSGSRRIFLIFKKKSKLVFFRLHNFAPI